MYNTNFNLIIKIVGETSTEDLPDYNSILDAIFPGGWVGDIMDVSGKLEYDAVDSIVENNITHD